MPGDRATRKKPETPEAQWAALEATMLASEEEAMAAQTDEELDASLRAQGMDPAKVQRESEAFAASLLLQLDAMEGKSAPAPSPEKTEAAAPSNVVPFAPRVPRRRGFAWLVAAAVAASLVIGTAVTVAVRDRPAPAPRAPEPEVLVATTPAQQVAALRADAERARAAEAWSTCKQKLDEADAIGDPALRGADPLRAACAAGAAASYRAQAKTAAEARDWGTCVNDLALWALSSGTLTPEADPLWQLCNERLKNKGNVKAP